MLVDVMEVDKVKVNKYYRRHQGNCIPVRMYCGGGGYYGLVIIMPCPQTLHHSYDNLKNPYRMASIFYM